MAGFKSAGFDHFAISLFASRPGRKPCWKPLPRLVIVWDPPVNAAVRDLWATRKVSARLKRNTDCRAQSSMRDPHAETYPILERRYDLTKRPADSDRKDDEDFWLIDLS
jgi:hypothetical protein